MEKQTKALTLSKTSWMAIVLSLGTTLTQPFLGKTGSLLLTLILLAYAFIISVYAILKGIPKETRPCLKHGIIGLSLCVAFFLVGWNSFQKARKQAQPRSIHSFVESISRDLPKMLGEGIRLDRVFEAQGNTIVNQHTLLIPEGNSLDVDAFYSIMEKELRSKPLPKQLTFLKEAGVTFRHEYYDPSGVLITNIVISTNPESMAD